MTNKRWTTEDKVRIIMESLTTSAGTAEICRKHGLSPNTFYPWREKFLRHDPQLRIGPSMLIILQICAPKHATFV